jgi:hypothetical protein
MMAIDVVHYKPVPRPTRKASSVFDRIRPMKKKRSLLGATNGRRLSPRTACP